MPRNGIISDRRLCATNYEYYSILIREAPFYEMSAFASITPVYRVFAMAIICVHGVCCKYNCNRLKSHFLPSALVYALHTRVVRSSTAGANRDDVVAARRSSSIARVCVVCAVCAHVHVVIQARSLSMRWQCARNSARAHTYRNVSRLGDLSHWANGHHTTHINHSLGELYIFSIVVGFRPLAIGHKHTGGQLIGNSIHGLRTYRITVQLIGIAH